jgi:hypothetical protein
MTRVLSVLVVALVAFGAAQNYRCDWSVNGVAGGSMSSTAYRSDATAGQTAAGTIASSAYQAFIGFWQIEDAAGVREQAQLPSVEPLITRLYAPQPNPARGSVVIRYSLAQAVSAALGIYDQTGRLVHSWAVSRQPLGVSSVVWDGRDASGRSMAEGVYFCKLTTNGYQATEKVLLTK